MKTAKTCIALVTTTILILVGFGPLVASQAPPAATPAVRVDPTLTPEEEAAKATFEAVCSTCHDAATATTTLRTRQEWAEVLDMMVSFGASASEEQMLQVARYLGRRYGRVNVNRAPADDLVFVLDVTPEQAEAIVTYRSSTRITSADALKAVPGLTAEKVAAVRTRLQF